MIQKMGKDLHIPHLQYLQTMPEFMDLLALSSTMINKNQYF